MADPPSAEPTPESPGEPAPEPAEGQGGAQPSADSAAGGEAPGPRTPSERSATAALKGMKVRSGTAWTIGGYAVANGLRLLGNLILTRLLFPEAFGLMQIINVFLQGLLLFTDLGISPCIIQPTRGEEPRFLNTAFAIQNMRGVALTISCLALTYPVVWFYESSDPLARELLWYLPVAGCSALIDGLVSTRLFTARRHLEWAKITKLEILSQVSALVVMVVWALISPSVWALVAGRVAFSLTRTGLSHLYLDGVRNWPTWEPLAARQLFHFGKWIFVSTLLTFLANQLDRLMLGKVVVMEALGVYSIAVSLSMLPTGALTKLGEKVFFPVFSRLKDRPEQLLGAVGRVRMPLVLCAGALIGGMIPGGPALIDFLYDDRYLEAGWMLQVLLLGVWFRILESPQSAIMLATGRTGWLAIGNGIKLISILTLLPLGWFKGGPVVGSLLGATGTDAQLLAAILGLAGADCMKYLYSVAVVKRLGVGVIGRDVIYSSVLALGVVAGMLVELHATAHLAEAHRWLRQLVTMSLAGGTGVLVWAAPIAVWWRQRRKAQP